MLASILKKNLTRKYKLLYAVVPFLCLVVVVSALLPAAQAHAFTPNYNASNLIDNPTLINTNSMSAGAIQAFLSNVGSGLAGYSDVEACDATIAPYYTHCGQTISAAQTIYDAGQAYGINPEAILATLEKEQSLVTDPTPSSSQINCAMGYNSCSNYVGFFTQVDNGTWALAYNYQGALRTATWLSWSPGANYPCRNASSLYSAGLYPGNAVTFANPGGTAETETLANAATASLYCYTPYVGPYSITGYSGSYNFVYYFQLWFGATTVSTPYAWAYEGQWAYSDSARTQQFTATPTVAPGGKIYITLEARNVGYQTWNQSTMHLGTSNPMDRASAFADSSWLGSGDNRPTQLLESSVVPGQDGMFEFEMQAPSTTGTYNEYFNPVAEGLAWLNNLGFYVTVNVNNAAAANNSNDYKLSSGQTLSEGSYLLSPDSQSVLTIQSDGNLVLYSNLRASWNSGSAGSSTNHLVMQSDGNLVLYNQSNAALWDSQTSGNPGAYLVLQTDGNMVVYSTSNAALWATYTISNPNHLSYINTTFGIGRLYPGQSINTADGHYKLVLQSDGNLVLYDNNGKPLWASGTNGDSTAFLAMQGDGNLVLYGTNGSPLWYSGTSGNSDLRLVTQQDGNLVLYNPVNVPLWDTGTQGD
ncbi:MAG TPA: hypothetical protein VMR28_02420 [Candidatus Saccharimonadales bacterium]|nr:hypothetical protein [Candidatus Saccharimonadales bacterium]